MGEGRGVLRQVYEEKGKQERRGEDKKEEETAKQLK